MENLENGLSTVYKQPEEIAVEWENLIQELGKKEIALFEWKTLYNARSDEIIETTDFQTIYGKNNEKVRKEHVKNELIDWYNTIKDLEFSIDNTKRRISFLKAMIYLKMEKDII